MAQYKRKEDGHTVGARTIWFHGEPRIVLESPDDAGYQRSPANNDTGWTPEEFLEEYDPIYDEPHSVAEALGPLYLPEEPVANSIKYLMQAIEESERIVDDLSEQLAAIKSNANAPGFEHWFSQDGEKLAGEGGSVTFMGQRLASLDASRLLAVIGFMVLNNEMFFALSNKPR